MGRAEVRWRPDEVGEVVVVLGPWGSSDAGESINGAGPPSKSMGELAITSSSAGGIHGTAA